MAIFNVKCSECGREDRLLLKTLTFPACAGCGALALQRAARGPSSAVKETLDNGAMTSRLERFANAEELYAERALNADPNAGKSKR